MQQLTWFNRGFMRAQVVDGRLVLSDLRMGLEPDYTFNFVVAGQADGQWRAIVPEQVRVDYSSPPRVPTPVAAWRRCGSGSGRSRRRRRARPTTPPCIDHWIHAWRGSTAPIGSRTPDQYTVARPWTNE